MPVFGFPDRRSYDRMARVVRRAGDLSGGRGAMRYLDPAAAKMRLARTSAAHAAGATQAVNLCDTDFVERSPVKSVDAVNDSEVEIPDDTKIYIATFAGKTRIVQAFICGQVEPSSSV